MRHRRIVLIASLLMCGLTLGGCESMDASEWFNSKKPLLGERKPCFRRASLACRKGVPADLVEGYQPPPEPVPEPLAVEAKPKQSRNPGRNNPPRHESPSDSRRPRNRNRHSPIRPGAEPALVSLVMPGES